MLLEQIRTSKINDFALNRIKSKFKNNKFSIGSGSIYEDTTLIAHDPITRLCCYFLSNKQRKDIRSILGIEWPAPQSFEEWFKELSELIYERTGNTIDDESLVKRYYVDGYDAHSIAEQFCEGFPINELVFDN